MMPVPSLTVLLPDARRASPAQGTDEGLIRRMALAIVDLCQNYGAATAQDMVRLGFSLADIERLGIRARTAAQALIPADRQIGDTSKAAVLEPLGFKASLDRARAALAQQAGRAPISALAVAAALGRAEAYMALAAQTPAAPVMAIEAVQSALSAGLEIFDTAVLAPIAAIGHAIAAPQNTRAQVRKEPADA